MKKINLILCAFAIAVMGMTVSCSNELAKRKDVTYKDYENSYSFSGTRTTVKTKLVKDTDGSTTTKDVSTTTDNIKAGYAYVSWTDNKALSTNAQIYTINTEIIKGTSSKETVDQNGDPTSPIDYNNNGTTIPDYTNQEISGEGPSITINKIGGKYYFIHNGIYELLDNPDLTSGKDFTLKFSTTETTNNGNWISTNSTSKAENKTTVVTTYDFKFTAR